jgi:hypothetical protein
VAIKWGRLNCNRKERKERKERKKNNETDQCDYAVTHSIYHDTG